MATALPTLATDYSFSRPSLTVLEAHHYKGVGRYLSHTAGKNLSVAEAKALRAAGFWIWLVFEDAAERALQGFNAGLADAKFANQQADALGYPKDAVIFYAVDFDANPDQVKAYFEGAKSAGLRLVGAYGGIKITSIGLASYNWQTAAWSNGVVDSHANIYQRAVAKVPGTDEDVLLNVFPAWGLDQAAPHPSKTFPHIVEALKSNAKHAKDLSRIKNSAGKVVAKVTLAALAVERRKLERIVKKG